MSADISDNQVESVAASFRDPSGYVFTAAGVLYRQVNQIYQPNYDRLIASGLYQELVKAGLLIAHQEVEVGATGPCNLLQDHPA